MTKTTMRSMMVAGLLMAPAAMDAEDCCLPTASAALAAPATQPAKWVAYGDPMKLTDADNVDAATVLADLKKYEGKNVRLTGTVTGVCTKKGCWMKMSSNGSPMNVFVKFTCPVEGRLIPLDAKGKPAVAEGKLIVKKVSEKDARHIAEEDGRTKEEVAAIKGEQTQIEMEGPSALVAVQ